jgi:hypothetical protein
MVQFFPVIAIPVILILYKSSFNHYKEVVPSFSFLALQSLLKALMRNLPFTKRHNKRSFSKTSFYGCCRIQNSATDGT